MWIVLPLGAVILFAVIKMTGDRQCWLWLTLPVLFLCGFFCCEKELRREALECSLVREISGSAALDKGEQEKRANHVTVVGRVVKLTRREMGKDYLLEDVDIRWDDPQSDENERRIVTTVRLQVRISSAFPAIEGDRIQVTGQLLLFDQPTNPGQFDYGAYQASQGVYLQLAGTEGKVLVKGERRIDGYLGELKRYLVEVLVDCGGESGGTMAALVLGDKTYLPDERYALYLESGIGHVLTLSGLHLSLLGVGLYGILRKRLTIPQWPSSVLMAGGIWAYVRLIGGGTSPVRAAIALILSLFAGCVGKTYDLLSAAALGIIGILLQYPRQMLRPPFWLSFGAVFAMGGVLLELNRWLRIRERGGKWAKAILPPLVIQLTLMPVTAVNQYTLQTYGVLLNLLVVPMMGVLLGACVFVLMLGLLLPEGAGYAASLVEVGFGLLDRLCIFSMKLPRSIVAIGRPTVARLVVYGLVFAGLFIHVFRQNRRDWAEPKEGRYDEMEAVRGQKRTASSWKRWGLLIAVWCTLTLILTVKVNDRQLFITFLDVGQGDSIFLEAPNGTTILVDCGSSSEKQVSEYVAEPFLRWAGVDHLDYLVITHMDEDHMNGVDELVLSGVSVETLLVSAATTEWDKVEELCEKSDISISKVVRMSNKDVIKCGEVEIKCLFPERQMGVTDSENEASVVLQVEYGDFSCLLTGDLEGRGEKQLISALRENKKQGDPGITLLKVAHHGSQYSTSEELLSLLRPAAAVISCGERNPYGHPHKQLLERLNAVGTEIYSTPDCGAVLVKTDGKHWRIGGWKDR